MLFCFSVCLFVCLLRTGISTNWTVFDWGMLACILLWIKWIRIDTRSMTTGEKETSTAFLNQSTSHPTEQEELARIRMAQFRVAKDETTVFHN